MVICPKHGDQRINYYNLINGQGCYYCGREKAALKNKKDNKDFFEQIKNKDINIENYSFDKVDMLNRDPNGKITITCKKHGNFQITPDNFLHGHGCPKCNSSKLESIINSFLTDNKINFLYQYKDKWLGLQSIDFYLPDYNIGIECQGIQHFKPIGYFGGNKSYVRQKENDNRKRLKCSKNNVRLIYFSNVDKKETNNADYEIITDTDKLMEEIKRTV